MSSELFVELIKKSGVKGDINHLKLFQSFKYSLYPARAFALTLQMILENSDISYIRNLGKIMGRTSINNLLTELTRNKSIIKKDFITVPKLIEISGFGTIDYYDNDGINYVIQLYEHPVITPSYKLFGKDSCAYDFYGMIFGEYIKQIERLKRIKCNISKRFSTQNKTCEWVYSP